MNDDFDPYWHWLGIGPLDRPVDHYRLLGIERFESNLGLIGAAADERMTFVRTFQTGPRGAHTQRLLNDLAAARVCLLNPRTKATYDDFLRGLASVTPGGTGWQGGAAGASPGIHAGGESGALPPTVGSFPPLAGGSASPHLAAIPMATPVAGFSATHYAGQVPMARPVAMPPAGYAPAAAPPVSYYPAPPPTAPPRTEAAPPPAPRGKSSTTPVEPPSSSPDAGEPPEPIAARRWFPVAVIGAVVLVAGVVWGVGRYWDQPPPSDMESDDVSDTSMDETTDDNAEQPADVKKRSDDYPSEVILVQEGTGQINFPATVAKLLGPTLTLHVEGPDPVINGWTGDDDAVAWDFRVVRPDIFRVEITYAAEAAWAGGQYVVSVGDAEKSGDVVSSGGAGTFRTDKLFLPVRRKGKQTLTVRTAQRSGEQLWVLKSIRFEPQGVAGK